tara:strand:+ start:175 stop:279 length:105 start_codon:yes stop_codon:yes gene_type:complete
MKAKQDNNEKPKGNGRELEDAKDDAGAREKVPEQ